MPRLHDHQLLRRLSVTTTGLAAVTALTLGVGETAGADPAESEAKAASDSPTAERMQDTYSYRVTAPMNMRAAPGTEYPTTGEIPPGDLIEVKCATRNDRGYIWFAFDRAFGNQGYVQKWPDVHNQPVVVPHGDGHARWCG